MCLCLITQQKVTKVPSEEQVHSSMTRAIHAASACLSIQGHRGDSQLFDLRYLFHRVNTWQSWEQISLNFMYLNGANSSKNKEHESTICRDCEGSLSRLL